MYMKHVDGDGRCVDEHWLCWQPLVSVSTSRSAT